MTNDDMLLGRQVKGPIRYAPELLYPIPRETSRAGLGLTGPELPFFGEDICRIVLTTNVSYYDLFVLYSFTRGIVADLNVSNCS